MNTDKMREVVNELRDQELDLDYRNRLCDDIIAELDKAPKTEPVAWMVTTRIGSEHVDTMAKTKKAAKQIAIERYRNGSTVEHSEPVPLYLATAAGLTVDEVDQCMDEVGDPPDNPDHFWQWREKVSARLTAAMEAKTRKA